MCIIVVTWVGVGDSQCLLSKPKKDQEIAKINIYIHILPNALPITLQLNM